MLPGRWETQTGPAGRHVGHDRLRTLLAELAPDPAAPRPDAVLITATRSGDSDAYAELLRRHEPAGRLLLASLPAGALAGDSPHGDSPTGDAASPTVEDRLRAAGDHVLATVHAGAGPRAAFRPFFLRAVLRVSTSTSLDAGNGLHRSGPEQDPADPAGPLAAAHTRDLADPADRAVAHLPESVLTALWHAAVEHDSPERLAVVLGAEASDAAVAGYRAQAAFRRVYLRHQLDERADLPAPCREILETLGRHTFDGLYDEEAEEVSEHLRTCTSCTDLHRRLVAAGAALPERLAGLVLGPYATGYLAALRRTGPPAFALVDPSSHPVAPQPVAPSWTERLTRSGRQLWTDSWTGANAMRGRTAGVAALGTLAAASVATLAWGTVAVLGGTAAPVTDADQVRVPGRAVGDTTADGPEDDWMGFVQDSPTAPVAGVLRPTAPPTAAVTPEAIEAARPAARSDVVIDRRSPQGVKPTVTDGPPTAAPTPTPSRTATSAPVPPPAPAPQPTRTRTSTPAPPPPSHSSPPPTSEPSPPAPPPDPEPTPTPTPTTDPPPPEPQPTPTTTTPPDAPA
ncbi:hypothetical protein ABZV93_12345 [Actinopolymorpha sp. NPDC004070]|uniref:hypothetical protein n=1 Tax=Actinopolymorpha sp. NPDC004070 TaxID=3154548 RepID=UPI0033B6D864